MVFAGLRRVCGACSQRGGTPAIWIFEKLWFIVSSTASETSHGFALFSTQFFSADRIVNEWTIDGCPDGHSAKILRRIEMGTETFAAQDGGSAWAKELDEMRDYVQERCEDEQA